MQVYVTSVFLSFYWEEILIPQWTGYVSTEVEQTCTVGNIYHFESGKLLP